MLPLPLLLLLLLLLPSPRTRAQGGGRSRDGTARSSCLYTPYSYYSSYAAAYARRDRRMSGGLVPGISWRGGGRTLGSAPPPPTPDCDAEGGTGGAPETPGREG